MISYRKAFTRFHRPWSAAGACSAGRARCTAPVAAVLSGFGLRRGCREMLTYYVRSMFLTGSHYTLIISLFNVRSFRLRSLRPRTSGLTLRGQMLRLRALGGPVMFYGGRGQRVQYSERGQHANSERGIEQGRTSQTNSSCHHRVVIVVPVQPFIASMCITFLVLQTYNNTGDHNCTLMNQEL